MDTNTGSDTMTMTVNSDATFMTVNGSTLFVVRVAGEWSSGLVSTSLGPNILALAGSGHRLRSANSLHVDASVVSVLSIRGTRPTDGECARWIQPSRASLITPRSL